MAALKRTLQDYGKLACLAIGFMMGMVVVITCSGGGGGLQDTPNTSGASAISFQPIGFDPVQNPANPNDPNDMIEIGTPSVLRGTTNVHDALNRINAVLSEPLARVAEALQDDVGSMGFGGLDPEAFPAILVDENGGAITFRTGGDLVGLVGADNVDLGDGDLDVGGTLAVGDTLAVDGTLTVDGGIAVDAAGNLVARSVDALDANNMPIAEEGNITAEGNLSATGRVVDGTLFGGDVNAAQDVNAGRDLRVGDDGAGNPNASISANGDASVADLTADSFDVGSGSATIAADGTTSVADLLAASIGIGDDGTGNPNALIMPNGNASVADLAVDNFDVGSGNATIAANGAAAVASLTASGNISTPTGTVDAASLTATSSLNVGSAMINSAGAASVASLTSAGNISAMNGSVSAASVTSTGSVSAASVTSTGNISTTTGTVSAAIVTATGAVNGGSLDVGSGSATISPAGAASVTSLAASGNITTTTGTISAAGLEATTSLDVGGGNATVDMNGNIVTNGDVTVATGTVNGMTVEATTSLDVGGGNATVDVNGNIVTNGDVTVATGTVNGMTVEATTSLDVGGGSATVDVNGNIVTSGDVTAMTGNLTTLNVDTLNITGMMAATTLPSGIIGPSTFMPAQPPAPGELLAQASITSDAGDIVATGNGMGGNVRAAANVESIGGDIIALGGNIQSDSGNIIAGPGAGLVVMGADTNGDGMVVVESTQGTVGPVVTIGQDPDTAPPNMPAADGEIRVESETTGRAIILDGSQSLVSAGSMQVDTMTVGMATATTMVVDTMTVDMVTSTTMNVESLTATNITATGNLDATGNVSAPVKMFVHPHPKDVAKVIRYVCLEGPEHTVFARGRGRLEAGTATVVLPESFALVAIEEGLSVTVTPMGPTSGLYVPFEELTRERFTVREQGDGASDIHFSWVIYGVREGFETHKDVDENKHFIPKRADVPFATGMPGIQKLLIQNGTLEADGKPSRQTAERMGWSLREGKAGNAGRTDRRQGNADRTRRGSELNGKQARRTNSSTPKKSASPSDVSESLLRQF